ncbi:MAG: hypothetical protein ACE5H9_14000 [Anaerolineae bacterium]
MYPDDRVLVAVMNSRRDWASVESEGWYRLPVKHAPEGSPHFDYLAFYFTRHFDSDKWAIHYYAPIEGHELVTRLDLRPDQPDHPHAHRWYYKLQLGQLRHKIPPIIAHRWRRITFIATSGDRFEQALEISELFEQESAAGRLYVTLKEAGLHLDRNWLLKETGAVW